MQIIINPIHNPVFFYIFDYPIRYYGIVLALSVLAGIYFSQKLIKRKFNQKTLETFEDSIPFAIVFALIGARLFYILGSLDYYIENKNEILLINHGGISIWGAILFGILTIFIYTKIKKVSFLKYIDFYALIMPLCQAIGRFGNYFNQEAYGKPAYGFLKLYVDKPYRIEGFEDIEYYHPAFLYESVLDLIIFFILFAIYKKYNLKQGTIFYTYLILYSIVRLIIESIRTDSVLNISNIPIASLLSIFALIFGISGLIFINRHRFNH